MDLPKHSPCLTADFVWTLLLEVHPYSRHAPPHKRKRNENKTYNRKLLAGAADNPYVDRLLRTPNIFGPSTVHANYNVIACSPWIKDKINGNKECFIFFLYCKTFCFYQKVKEFSFLHFSSLLFKAQVLVYHIRNWFVQLVSRIS